MALKSYSVRLDEEDYEKLWQSLSKYGDADLNIGYLMRAYIKDLNSVIPHLKKSPLGLRNILSFWSSAFRQMSRNVDIEDIIKGKAIAESMMSSSDRKKKSK